jgi:hypothetical protein
MSGDPEGTGGGSAGDFDDTVGTKVGGGARGDYQSQIEAAEARGEDVTFERLQQATGDAPATGGDADRAAADRAAVQSAIEAARGQTSFEKEKRFYTDYINKGASSIPGFDKTDGGTKKFDIDVVDLEENVIGKLTPGVSRAERIQEIQGLTKVDDPFVSSAARATLADLDIFTEPTSDTDISSVTVGSPAQQQIQAARVSPVDFEGVDFRDYSPSIPTAMTNYQPAAPERTFPSPYEQFIGAPNIQTSQGRAPEQTDMRSFRTGLPSSVEVLGAKVPTGIGVLEGVVNAVTDPKGTLEQALYNQGAKSIQNIETGKNIETGNEAGLEVITAGDRTAAYDPVSNIVYDTNPFDFSGITPEIQGLYDKKRQRDEQDRGSDDPIIPPLIPEDPLAQGQTPEPVVGQNVITGANYQPREPVQFAYTGLPTLAPVSLQPTFQAQQQFTPTFGLDSLRRS